MKNTCPECGTVYAVTAKDVGRRIACKKCGEVLLIGKDGFVPESEVEAVPVEVVVNGEAETPGDIDDGSVERPVRRRHQRPIFSGAQQWAERYIDIPTFVFGVGAFIVLAMLFMPLIGKAKVERRTGLLQEEQFDHEQEIKKLREKPGNDEKVKAAEETWNKRRDVLSADIKYAEFGNARSGYSDRYGLLFGFVILMVGSLGMMRSESGLVKRIFGAAVLGVQMVLVFGTILGGCGRLPGG